LTPAALVFLRLPEPGRVKTRLAAGVGAGAAARIYEALARGVVERLRLGPWRLEVHFAPGLPEAGKAVRAWLEHDTGDASTGPTLRYVPQVEGDLGMRMERALAGALASGAPAAVLASDVPGLGPRHLAEAFRFLEASAADLVLGPCPDGGYYLMALRSGPPPPGLFRGVPWSTDRVLETTLSAARDAGLRVHMLEPLTDVDRPEDLGELDEPAPGP
jgi:uncharacterized protein